MRKLLIANIKMLFRDKESLFWAIAFPVILTSVFGLFDLERPETVRGAVVVTDGDPTSRALATRLDALDAFEVRQHHDFTRAKDQLVNGHVDVVVVPEGARGSDDSSTAVRVLYSRSNVDTNDIALPAIASTVDGLNLTLAAEGPLPLTMALRAVDARAIERYDWLLPGLLSIGVMASSVTSAGVAIARFRDQRVFHRLAATPLRPSKFLVAFVTARLLLAMVQTAAVLLVGTLVFGAELYGNVLFVFVLAAAANLFFLNVGFAIGGRSPNPDAAQGFGNAISVPLMFLSGIFFPIASLPQILEDAVPYLPLTLVVDTMRSISLESESLASSGEELGLLAVWLVVGVTVSLLTFRPLGSDV